MLVLAQSTSFHDDFPFVENYIIPPAWRSLNNSEDIICLQNPSGSLIFNLQYNADWDIPSDCAMQLVDTSLDHVDPHNWEIAYMGSPGKYNVTEKQLRHLLYYFENDFYIPEDTLQFIAINDGYFSLEANTLMFKTPLSEQLIYLPASNPGDTFTCQIDTSGIFVEGTNSCLLSVIGTHGFRSTACHIKYYYPYSKTPLFFNEVMFDPIDTYGQAEFIELEGIHIPFDLDQWAIRVNNNRLELKDSLFNKYTVLCDKYDPLYGMSSNSQQAYSGFPNLPNGGADLYLIDPCGRTMDHVFLCDHAEICEGKSLEKAI